jgi:hypothetical protein
LQRSKRRFRADDPTSEQADPLSIDGRCRFRSLAADFPAEHIAEQFPECVLKVAAGDDFACRSGFAQVPVSATLTGKVGRKEILTHAGATCRPPTSSDDLRGALNVTIDDDVCRGNDPTFRFGLRNPTPARLTDISCGSPQPVRW